MNREKIGTTFINSETGEIHEGVVKLISAEQEQVIEKKKRTSVKNKKFNDEIGGFMLKAFTEETKEIDEIIKHSDLTRLMYISTFVDYDEFIKKDNGVIMTKKDIMGTINVDRKIFSKWFDQMIELEIITEDNGGYKMSKGYCMKGNIKKGNLYKRVFIEGTRKLYECNIKSNQKTLGQMLNLIPHINVFTNILCQNPLEENPDEVEAVRAGDLAKFLGYGRDVGKMMNAISKIRVFDGHPLVLFFNDDENKSDAYLMFHPKIVYSGKNDDFDNLFKLFAMKATGKKVDRKTKPSSGIRELHPPKGKYKIRTKK